MKPLRWHAASTERSGAMIVISVCTVLLASIIFWPASAPESEHTNKTEQLAPIVAAKPAQLNTQVKPITEPKKYQPSVTPRRPAPAVVKSKNNSVQSGYLIQVGAFKSQQRAIGLKNKLSRKHWPVSIKLTTKHLYSVRVGPYPNLARAKKNQSKLQRLEKLQSYITHH
ncbi:MAG: SPOR domain-containing protein [Mariprofundaceae bacterium]